MEYNRKKTVGPSSAHQDENERHSFYNGVWKEWDNMIRYSPAPRIRRDKVISWLLEASPRTVLDVGCGNGEFLLDVHRSMPQVKLAGADISSAVIEANRAKTSNIDFVKIDLDSESLSQTFDTVVCMEVVEHCRDHRAAIKRLADMTEKYLFLTVPCGPVFEIDCRVGHQRHFRSEEIVEALAKEDLKVIKMQEWGFPFFNLYKHAINLRPDAFSDTFLSQRPYGFMQKVIASLTYAAFKLCLPKWGYQLFVMAGREGPRT